MATSGTEDTIAPAASALDDTVAPPTSELDDTMRPPTSGLDDTVAPPAAGPQPAASDDSGLGTVAYTAYAFDRALSRGGMGKISVATDRRLRRTVALKEVIAEGAQARRRFLREAEITAQLQHPSIVPIYEAGYWPNGEPFYAMKLVDGRPLRELIEQAATMRDRIALLPNVVAVSDALAYAHARRIIHRDLKPDNVLVGEYGETVVIDWGLAKRLGVDSDDVGADAAPDARDVAQTQAGAAVGTPAFMSPEQGRGEAIDERTDVYALGAILYNLLTGHVPYGDSKSVVELLDRLEKEPPKPVLALAADAPPDLVTIVEKAMARDVAARYASARELADDLRRYTTGQLVGAHVYSLRQLLGRWVRKHRGMLAVAGIAAAAMLVLAGFGLQRIRRERTVAEAQRAEARAHRADVESLLDFMLIDLRKSLKKTGSLDALGGVVQRAQDYFATHDPGDSPDDLTRSAQALSSVAQVLVAQGNAAEGLAAYQHAADTAQRALRRHPQHARAFEVWWLARSHHARNRTARADLGRADQILAELDPTKIPVTLDQDTRDLLVASRAATASVVAFARSDLAAARTAAAAELEARTRRLDRQPAAADRAVEVATVYSGLTMISLREWNLPSARAETERGLAVLAAGLAREPANQELRLARATMLERVGAVAQAEGKQADALKAFEDLLAISEDLLQLDGSNVEYLRQVSLTENKVATAQLNRGDVAAARTHQARSTAIAQQLHDRDGGNDDWTRDLSIAYDRESAIARSSGKYDDALAFARQSEALRKELIARHPDDSNAHRDLGIARALLGEMLVGLGRAAEAVESYRAGVENFEALVRLEPDTIEFQVNACEISKGLGYALSMNGDRDGALAVLRPTWTKLVALNERPEATDMWRVLLGQLAQTLTEILIGRQELDEAAAVIGKGVTTLDAVVSKQPDAVIFAQELTGALALQSMVLDRPATAGEAAAALARSRALITALAAKYPENAGVARYKQIIDGMSVRNK